MASNPYVNKVTANGVVIIDLTADTVTADTLMQGYTAHDSTGAAITGSYTPPTFTTQTKTATPSETAQTVTPDSGYDGLSSVSVGAISSTYVGSGIDQRDSSDLTASGATVTVPAGYYAEQASKAVASGSAGTPTATKGTVSNHAVSVTPSVTNTTGYIAGGTKTGTAVSVSASELVSGSETKTENGTYDVTNLASLIVDVDGDSSSYTLTTIVPQQTVTVSSSTYTADGITMNSPFVVGDYYLVTYDGTEYLCTGGSNWDGETYIGDSAVLWYDGSGSGPSAFAFPFALERLEYNGDRVLHATSGSHTVKVEHLEFVDGPLNLITKSITANGTYNASSDNADGYSSVTVNVPSGSSMNVQTAQSTTRVANTAYTKTASLTCSTTGIYDVYWDCFRSTTSGTSGSQLHVGGSAYGSANTTFSNHAQSNHLTGVQIYANQEVAVYVRSRATNYYAYCGQLTIVQTA